MRIRIIKRRKKEDINDIIHDFEARYGSLGSLHQRVLISKCSTPNQMSDYVMWKYLSSGAELEESVVLETPELFDVLSPKRAELLEYLTNNDVTSIRTLASKLHRNYKNVYDDLKALVYFELVELRASGRAVKPQAAASEININFGD
jgi:hypothetical protein